MNRVLIVAIVLISTAPLYAQRQQQNVAKLKADAQKVVSIISGDEAKTQAYCEARDIAEQIAAARPPTRHQSSGLVQHGELTHSVWFLSSLTQFLDGLGAGNPLAAL